MKKKNWLHAIISGLVPVSLEALLLLVVDPQISGWVLLQSLLFWQGCGMVVYLATAPNHDIFKSILLTIFLNLPWYIALSVVPGKIEHLIPLVIASIILGLTIGFVGKILGRIEKTRESVWHSKDPI